MLQSGGTPYLAFNGSTNILSNPSINLGVGTNTGFTVIVIAQINALSTSNFSILLCLIMGLVQLEDTMSLKLAGSYGYSNLFVDSGGNRVTTGTLYILGNITLQGLEVNRNVGAIFNHYGAIYRFVSGGCATNTTNYNGFAMSVGALSQAGGFFTNVYVYDMLFYTKSLSQTEYLGIYNYFKKMYNIVN